MFLDVLLILSHFHGLFHPKPSALSPDIAVHAHLWQLAKIHEPPCNGPKRRRRLFRTDRNGVAEEFWLASLSYRTVSTVSAASPQTCLNRNPLISRYNPPIQSFNPNPPTGPQAFKPLGQTDKFSQDKLTKLQKCKLLLCMRFSKIKITTLQKIHSENVINNGDFIIILS